ncbi:MAG: hypothetical protein HZA08_11775 [Nitrospirae bacterium]|nr:hypothetical protein [Nitrospirota bacterium]
MRSTQRWPEDEMHKCIGYFMTDPKCGVSGIHAVKSDISIPHFAFCILPLLEAVNQADIEECMPLCYSKLSK